MSRKGYAIEGFVNEDGTIRALKTYDDTEVRGLIEDNASAIASLELSKADKNEIVYDDDDYEASVRVGEDIVNISVANHQEGKGGEVDITPDNISNLARALNDPDTVPTEDSDELITSGGVKSALSNVYTKAATDSLLSGKQPVGNYPTVLEMNSALLLKANATHTHLPVEVEGAVPQYISYTGSTIDLDDVIQPEFGMKRIILRNDSGAAILSLSNIFYSSESYPIHENKQTSVVIEINEYVLFTIFKIDILFEPGEHEHDMCFFVTTEGLFDDGNNAQ